jgi:C-terminal processing protease CtpA/Prc
MKIGRAALVFVCALAATTALPQSVGSSADDAPAPLRTAYLALVQESLVPADPRTIAMAALEVMSPATALPSRFGTDAQRDADWLSAQAGSVVAPWDAINAMARAAAIAHVGFVTPGLRRGMRALGEGRPLSTPGFSVHRLSDGRTVVRDLVAGGSAQLSGLREGDVLTRIGDERVSRQTTLVMPLIARPAGDLVLLEIERDRKPLRIEMRMVDAGQTSVDSRLLDDGLAYVRIRWFSQSDDPMRDTASLARAAFQSLAEQGARGLVLDLRSALGGAGEVAVASALADGDIIYHVQQPMTKPPEPVRRAGARIWPERPVVVLVNEQTVSAGEALALSLRELTHCLIVGQTTAGGLTEFSRVRLSSEYALIIPTGLVLGPVTRQDQPGHAVRPDVELPNAGIDDLVQGRDPQLQAARSALEGVLKRRKAMEPR